MSTTVRNAPSRQSTPGTWQWQMAAFINNRCNNIDAEPCFTDLHDTAIDWAVIDGSPTDAGGMNGNIYLGSVTGANSVHPKYGNASFLVSGPRQFPFAIACRATPVGSGATVTHAPCFIRTPTTRVGFGYKGALSTAFYSIWSEDNTGAVIGNSTVTTVPVQLGTSSGTANQNFVLIYNGVFFEAFYGNVPDATNLTLAGTLEDNSNLPLTTGMFPCCFGRTSGGGTELGIYGALMSMTMNPR